MENLEIMNLVVDLTALAQQVQRMTNYVDVGCANPSAQNVLDTNADSKIYADLLTAAKNRVLAIVGRHTKAVDQPSGSVQEWVLTFKVPACNNTPLLAQQLHDAVVEGMATYMVAHWLMLVSSSQAEMAVQRWTDADHELRNLSLWRNRPPQIALSVF